MSIDLDKVHSLLEWAGAGPPAGDWLIESPAERAALWRSPDSRRIVLANGLVSREFVAAPNAATVALDDHMTGASLLRAVGPEARLTLDGALYDVGGLSGQPDLAFIRPEWVEQMKPLPGAFAFAGFSSGPIRERLSWNRRRHSAGLPWPPRGVELVLRFVPPVGGPAGIRVDVHYEMYDGLPLIGKWLEIHNEGECALRVDRFTSEILALVEYMSESENAAKWEYPKLTVASDYAFMGVQTAYWETDPEYKTQVNYELQTPVILACRPPIGPSVEIAPGETFSTFRVFLLVHDSTERERRGLAVRRMVRTLAPWATENPIMMHLTDSDPAAARRAIDQCADVGFETVIFSFGSGIAMEDASEANIARYKEMADYAHDKGIEIGGYSLLASRHISDEDDVLHPATGKPGGATFGYSPCLGSAWGERYLDNLKAFLAGTGFDLLEHDGSYPGDLCASTCHPGHAGLDDSQWRQFQQIAGLYAWCRGRGVSLNVPDNYLLAGSTKTGMGYRETNWSLPRELQLLHARQNMYDGTWEKTPSMGWMFAPLVQYHGGGPAATIEPLCEHLDDYERHLAANFGFGVQACWRGPRLYDAEETRALVKKWVAWFKAHRAILESDIVHVRRADARSVDAILHVNPGLPERGLAMFYNPAQQTLTQEFALPLYYTGLMGKAKIETPGGETAICPLDRAGRVRVKVTVPAGGCTYLIVRSAGA